MKEEQIDDFLDFIREEILQPLWEDLKEELKEAGKDMIKDIAKDELPKLKKFVSDLLTSKNVKCESVDVLTKSDMISLIRLNRVNGSDGVAAFKQQKDEKMFVYLAYCKDRDLLPEETNCYIVIEANALNEDVENLFKESDLIILN